MQHFTLKSQFRNECLCNRNMLVVAKENNKNTTDEIESKKSEGKISFCEYAQRAHLHVRCARKMCLSQHARHSRIQLPLGPIFSMLLFLFIVLLNRFH